MKGGLLMSWVTIDEAMKTKGSKASWKRWIASGTVPAKLEKGRRFVWLTPDPEERLSLELERHRDERLRWAEIIANQDAKIERLTNELAELKRSPSMSQVKLKHEPHSSPVSQPNRKKLIGKPLKKTGPKPLKPMGKILPSRHSSILRQIEQAGLTLAAVEIGAGISRRFLTKAKLGQRSGPRSAKSWAKVESFLQQGDLTKAISA
jgi:hypothetical protein